MRWQKILRDRRLTLLLYCALIAIGFIALAFMRQRNASIGPFYFLLMTASMPVGPLVDLLFFKLGNDYPRQLRLFNLLLPLLVTFGSYAQWRYAIPWVMARLAQVRRRRTQKRR